MITSLITLLSSGAFGSLIGLIGGYFNRKLDLQIKRLDHEQELKVMDKNLEFMKAEYEQKTAIATIEGQAATEVAGYNAMTASYSYAEPTGNTLVDKFSRVIRPLITLSFFLLTVYLFYTLNEKISISVISQESIEKVYLTVIEWILFQSGISIGWWFANRQSGPSIFGGKK